MQWSRPDKQLRSCKATVSFDEDVYAVECKRTGEVKRLCHTITLNSYSSVVTIYDADNQQLYMLPYWDCSATTHQHVRKFVEDYCPKLSRYYCAPRARESFNESPDSAMFVEASQFSRNRSTVWCKR